VNELELKKFILDELLKLKLNGIEMIDFSMGSSSVRFVIKAEKSIIDFVVNNDNQFQILSVIYNGKKYVDSEYLRQFNDFIAAIINIIKPVVKEKADEYVRRPDMIKYREEQAKLKEEQLEKRVLAIQAREQLLEFHMQAIDIENQIFEDEKVKNKKQKLLAWMSERIFLFKWIGIAITVALIVLLFLRILQ